MGDTLSFPVCFSPKGKDHRRKRPEHPTDKHVVPMLFAYGLHNKRPEYCERATRLLESITPEKNTIVTTFYNAGITVRHAGDSQALIQLKREYCEKKKCLYCRIGFRMLKTTIGQKSV